MREAFEKLIDEYERLGEQLADPAVTSNPGELRRVAKAHAELEPSVQVYREYEAAVKEREESAALLEDADDELKELKRGDAVADWLKIEIEEAEKKK